MPTVVRTVEAIAAKHYLTLTLNQFADLAVSHLSQIARNGGLNGKSPNANVLARLIEGETGKDLSELSESEARALALEFRALKRLKILPPGGQDHVERYFLDLEPEHNASTHPKAELLLETCEEVLEQNEIMGI